MDRLVNSSVVEKEVQQLFTLLSEVFIEKEGSSADVVSLLKTIPRTGKACRIDKFSLPLPKRSLFCHILSLATQAHILSSYAQSEVSDSLLAKIIVFHDLTELIIGDVPDFTSKELAGESYLSKSEKKQREMQAVTTIAEFFNSDLQADYLQTLTALENDHTFFTMVDKTDPIIATWRYLYHFKDLSIDVFLDSMTDFFTNPKVVSLCSNDVARFIEFLLDKENARSFYQQGFEVFKDYHGPISLSDIKLLLSREIECCEELT